MQKLVREENLTSREQSFNLVFRVCAFVFSEKLNLIKVLNPILLLFHKYLFLCPTTVELKTIRLNFLAPSFLYVKRQI